MESYHCGICDKTIVDEIKSTHKSKCQQSVTVTLENEMTFFDGQSRKVLSRIEVSFFIEVSQKRKRKGKERRRKGKQKEKKKEWKGVTEEYSI